MYCIHCGTELKGDAKFCLHCGGPLPQTGATQSPPAGESPPTGVRSAAQRAPRQRMPGWMLVVLTALVVVAVGTAAAVVSRVLTLRQTDRAAEPVPSGTAPLVSAQPTYTTATLARSEDERPTEAAASPVATATAVATSTPTPQAAVGCPPGLRAKIESGDYRDLKPGAELAGCDLSGLDLTELDLSGANLEGADLTNAYLSETNLSGANLSGALIGEWPSLSETNLSRANLSGVKGLGRALCAAADLSNADLTGAALTLCRPASGAAESWVPPRSEGANLRDAILTLPILAVDVAWSPSQNEAAVVTGSQWGTLVSGESVLLLSGETHQVTKTLFKPSEYHRASGVYWHPDGELVAVRTTFGVTILDATQGTLIGGLNAGSPAWSPDGKRLATIVRIEADDGTTSHQVHLLDTSQLDALATEPVSTGWFSSPYRWPYHEGPGLSKMDACGEMMQARDDLLAWSPDGQLLAVACGGQVRVLDVSTGETVHLLRHPGWGQTLAWDPTGARLATSTEAEVRIWDTATGAPLTAIQQDAKVPGAVAWRPDGGLLAVGGRYRTIRLYEPESWSLVATLDHYEHTGAERPSGELQYVYERISWRPDGQRLAAVAEKGRADLWPIALLLP